MKKITLKDVIKSGACGTGVEWYKQHGKDTDYGTIRELIKQKKYDFARWALTRSLDKMQNVKFAIYCAEQVLKIYEDKYTDDNRPRDAIRAAKAYLKNPNKETASCAAAASDASYAAYAAYAASDAAADAYAAYAEMNTKIFRYVLRLLKSK